MTRNIYNPSICQIEPGMMIRARLGNVDNWGQMVDAVDLARELVLVRHYIGGELEHSRWIPISDVLVVWKVARDVPEVEAILALFDKGVREALGLRPRFVRPRRAT